jgi:3-phosphoshikimate 1-carboxyvinyltransferase
LLSALANGHSVLTGGLESDDTQVMQKALELLGVRIQKEERSWNIFGNGGKFPKKDQDIYLGNAGTAMRFLVAASGLCTGTIRLFGKERMHERPIQDLLNALHKLGISLRSEKETGCPPIITIGTGSIPGGICEIPGDTSSQFLSALLHISPLTQKGVQINIIPPLVSKPYIQMTIALLEKFGIKIECSSEYKYIIHPQTLSPVHMEIEADASSAAHIFSLVGAGKGDLCISNFPKKSLQGDAKYLEILKKFGADISSEKEGVRIQVRRSPLPLGEVNFEDMPDVSLPAAALACLAHGKTKLTGLSTLRKKECDRIKAMQKNIQKMGGKIISGNDFLEIDGDPNILHGAEIETFDDHRIAMSFAVLGTQIPGVTILNPDCVRKTFPNFWEIFESIRST